MMTILKRVAKIAIISLAILAGLLLAFILINQLLDLSPHVVYSNSMRPKFSRGDVIYIKQVDAESLTVGDIITVKPLETNYTVTHRIEELHMDEGYLYIEGDQNSSGERVRLGFDEILGVYVYHIPWIGLPVVPENS